MTSTIDFLKRILPDESTGTQYCAFVLESRRHYFTGSLSGLAQGIVAVDAAKQTVYHACASFGEARRRSGDNAALVKAFWLDLDAGPDKPYVDQQACIEALRAFCSTLSLPPPILVNSGYGVHVYWTLTESISRDIWLPYANGLKRLCNEKALHADPSRTADISSILRTPGTHNRKGGEDRKVVAGILTGPYQLKQFEVFANAVEGQNASLPTKRPTGNLAKAIGDMWGDQSSDAGLIADQCKQLGEMRATLGRLPENVWHAGLGVIAHCGDDAIGHEWSVGDERYDATETQYKIDRWKERGPATCVHFEKINPKGCEGCPWKGKITSPIQLGRLADVPQRESDSEVQHENETLREGTHKNGVSFLPKGFAFKNDSLIFQTSRDDRTIDLIVVKHRLELTGVQYGEMAGDHAYVFKHKLPKEAEKEFSIPAQVLFGMGGRGELQSKGANVLEWNHFQKYVMGAIDIFRDEHKATIRYEQFGWKQDKYFLYGQTLYTPGGKIPVLTTGDLQTRCEKRGIGPVEGGSLEGWTKHVNQLFAAGLEVQSLCVLASFAAPLMRFQEEDEGGAVLHLMSGSAKGKTTAMIGATSVWGKFDAMRIKKDDTTIGRLLILAHMSNLPIAYDEIQTADPELIYDFVVSFTGGSDKTRATRAGEIKHNEARWQTILISGGNTSLREALGRGDKPDTQAHRVMELECTLPKEIADNYSDQIKVDLRNNRGYAGDVYIQWVVNNLDTVKEMLADITAMVRKDVQLNNDYRFWVRTIGSIMTAAMIVKKLGLIEFSPDRIYTWIKEYVQKHKAAPIHEMSEVDNLAKFYNDNIGHLLPVAGPYFSGRQLNMDIRPIGKLYMRRENSTSRLYVAIGPFRDWAIKHGVHFKGLVDVLFEKRICVNKNKFVTLGAGTPLAAGQTRCLEIDLGHAEMNEVLPPPEQPK